MIVRLIVKGLSAPPGKNRRHTIIRPFARGGGRAPAQIGLTPEARGWMEEVSLRVKMARRGRPIPQADRYALTVICHLYATKMDADAPLSLALDGIESALGLNDTFFTAAPPVKHIVDKQTERSVDLYISIQPVATLDEWNQAADAHLAAIKGALGWTD